MRRATFIITIIAILTLALAACTSRSADDEADDTTAEVTEVPESTPIETPDVDDADDAAPDADDDRDPISDLEELERDEVIAPEEFYLVAGSGQQTGWPRTYFWSDPEEMLAVDIEGHYVPLPEEPLQVEPGESVTLEWERDDIDPEEITISVYPREDNFEENVSTRDGDSDAFYPNTEPELTEEVDPADASWTVDLEEGEYFLLIDTLWPTPEGWPSDREAQFGFWIIVE